MERVTGVKVLQSKVVLGKAVVRALRLCMMLPVAKEI